MPVCLLLAAILTATHPEPRAAAPPSSVSIELQDADIHDVLRTFANVGRVNIVAAPDVSGRVSGRFDHVPWEEALRQVLCSLQLTMEWDGNVIFVARA